ncbi:FecCD family ABC transporter permease [Paenibacillus turpanensis]|uniref:FecCD family ABC transporter permease n=1 Tax=Paenibacillus turpanensis TaxID=2689078 RepID=UPI00140E4A6B|nr:iron ABC transporter permease [Paenibacillus turpanensis]
MKQGLMGLRRPAAAAAGLGLALLAVLFALIVVSASTGTTRIPFLEAAAVLLGGGDEAQRMIIFNLRLPRTLAAVLVGSALAVSGALMQGVFRNPLASPDLMGVSGGASVLVVGFLTVTASRYSIHLLPFIAVCGAFGAAAMIYALAWKRGVGTFRLLLIGVGVSTAASALTTFLLISGPAYMASQVLNWLTGTLYGTSKEYVWTLLPWAAVFIPAAWAMSRHLNVLALGDATAVGLGSAVNRTRLLLLFFSVALAGASVGIAGNVSFVGLIAPHMARSLVGNNHARMIPISALLGALLLVLADLAGRTLFSPYDLPAGIFTAAFGAPFFFYLLYKRKGR